MNNVERRSASCLWEIRETPDGVVGLSGYAAVFDSEAHGEVVRRSAFNKTLQEGADVRFLINHDGLPLARRSGSPDDTMRLRVDNVGLRMEIDELDMASPVVQSLVSAIKRGDIDQMSFAFMAVRDNYTPDGVRELTEVKLVDVSAVTYPWYEQTSIGMKSDDRELVEARDGLEVPVDGSPMLYGTDTDVLSDKISAVDAAIDAAQTLLSQCDESDPVIAQAYALLCAADSALEDVQEALGIADPDDMMNESQPVDLAPDEPQGVEPQMYAPMRTDSDRPNIRAHALDALRRTVSRA